MASQALNSLTNLAAAALVAHVVSPGAFGAWAVVFAGYGLVVQASRALVVTPVLVHDDVIDRVPRWLSSQACSAALGTGLLGAVPLLVTCVVLLPRSMLVPGVVVSAGLPLLLVQDALRNEAIRNSTGWWAAALDLAWALLQLGSTLALFATGRGGVTGLTISWVLGGAAGGLVGLLVLRRRVSIAALRSFAQDNREASMKLLLESFLGQGVLLLLPPLLAIVSGFAVAGAIRAGQTVFGPITFLMAGLLPLLTTVTVQRVRRGAGLSVVVVTASIATAVLSLLIGVAVAVVPALGRSLAGNSWSLVREILPALILAGALRGPIAAVPAALRGTRLFDEVVGLRVRTAVPAVGLPLGAAVVWGLSGAAWGMAAAALVNTAQTMRSYRRHLAGTRSGRQGSALVEPPLG